MEMTDKTPVLPASLLVPEEATPTLDMGVLDGQIYTVLKNRIERAKKSQADWWLNGKNMRAFMDGEQWEADLKNVLTIENGWVLKTVNKMKALRTGLVSQIAFQEPKVVGLPLRRLPEFINKANVASTLINHSISESNFQVQQKKAALDSLSFGAGFVQFCTDPERGGIPGVTHRCAEDIVVDPDAKTIEDAKWIARRFPANIFSARKEYDDESLRSDREQDPDGNKLKEGEVAICPEDETVEIWEVWCRADAINFMDAKEGNARNATKDSISKRSPAFLKHVSESGNRVFHINLKHEKILSDKPWPFILDHDLLPIWPLYMEESTNSLLPGSVLQPAKSLQRAINTMMTFLTTQAYTSARIKFSMDKQSMADGNVMKGLKSAEVGTLLPTDGGSLGLQPVNMGQLNLAMVQMLKETDNFFNQITGYNEMFGGMQGARSAAEAVIREDRAQTNSSTMRQAFETGLKRVIRGMWQIAMSTMEAKDVAEIVGREEMGYVDESGAVNDDDTLNKLPINWPYDKATPAEIRRENFIEYVVNSTRRANPQQEAQDLRGVIQDLTGLVGLYTQQGYRINKVRLARKVNYVFGRVLQALGVADFKQMEVTPEDLEIDDRLMPRGPTEEQMIAKLDEQRKGEQDEVNAGNVDALAEALSQQMGVSIEEAKTVLAGLTPEMMQALVQVVEGGGSMQGGPQPLPPESGLQGAI